MSQKKFLTSSDVMAAYGISEEALQELVDAGELKALPDRGTFKFRREDLESLISSGRLSPSREMPTVDDIDFDESIGFAEESGGDDRVDFLELDEDALSAGSTVISTSLPSDLNDLHLSFTDAPEVPPSSSDVQVFEPGDALVSDSEILVKGTSGEVPATNISNSDVQLVPDEPEQGSPVDNSDDNTLFEQTVIGSIEEAGGEETLFETPEAEDWLAAGDDNLKVTETPEQMTEELPSPAQAYGQEETLAFDAADSGLTLETGDSGLTLDTGDSGLTLDAGDSGLTLDSGDSGLTLDTGDSGLSLEVVPDDMAPAARGAGTQRMEQLEGVADELDFDTGNDESGGTRRMAVEEKFAAEHSFTDDDSEDHDQTAVIMVEDESGEADYVGTLSGAIAAGEDVEDLEISDDLEMGLGGEDDGVEFDDADDAVLEAEDEAFSDEFAGTGDDDDDYLQPAAKAAPREPSWGAFTSIMVIAAGALIGTNVWLMWEGVATMWNGGQPSGAAASLISAIAGIMG